MFSFNIYSKTGNEFADIYSDLHYINVQNKVMIVLKANLNLSKQFNIKRG